MKKSIFMALFLTTLFSLSALVSSASNLDFFQHFLNQLQLHHQRISDTEIQSAYNQLKTKGESTLIVSDLSAREFESKWNKVYFFMITEAQPIEVIAIFSDIGNHVGPVQHLISSEYLDGDSGWNESKANFHAVQVVGGIPFIMRLLPNFDNQVMYAYDEYRNYKASFAESKHISGFELRWRDDENRMRDRSLVKENQIYANHVRGGAIAVPNPFGTGTLVVARNLIAPTMSLGEGTAQTRFATQIRDIVLHTEALRAQQDPHLQVRIKATEAGLSAAGDDPFSIEIID